MAPPHLHGHRNRCQFALILPHFMLVDDHHINFSAVVVAIFSLSWIIVMQFVYISLRLIHLLLIYPHKVIIIGKHGVCSLIVWFGQLVSCPVFSNSKQFFSSLSDSIANWMPISKLDANQVSEQEAGGNGPGPALMDSLKWGGESTPVDLDLKNSTKRSGHSRWHLDH
jgi:hypothetical protein